MNQKAGFEVVLRRCEHVIYVTVRTISMITISMITKQNLQFDTIYKNISKF